MYEILKDINSPDDVKKLNISDVSGFSDDEIKLNYDYLIDYNLNNKVEEFNLPTIKYSTQGKIHFEEVRNIFQIIKKVFYQWLLEQEKHSQLYLALIY